MVVRARLRCPRCKATKPKVNGTDNSDPAVTVRYRVCLACGWRFTELEQ